MIEKLLFDSKNISRSSYFWNATASSINAMQSVIILIIVARTIGSEYAGVFSFAWTFAHLLITLGNFNMRYYQVTDVSQEYRITEYVASRIATVVLMICIAFAYAGFGIVVRGYSSTKAIIVILICVWKAIDAFEDVFHGWFQQQLRLDVACKAYTARCSLGLISYCISLIISNSLIVATLVAILFSTTTFVICTLLPSRRFGNIEGVKLNGRAFSLLKDCVPLCLTAFLITYIANAPKYAIDAYLTDEIQAVYNYIFMPVFAIGLVASFIYNPIVSDLGSLWNERKLDKLMRLIKKQIVVVLIISIIIIVIGGLIGLPILSLLYATELSLYKWEFIILLCGGGLYAIICLLAIVLTTIREQKALLIGYVIAAGFAKLSAYRFVGQAGIKGAVMLYAVSMVLLCGVLLIITTIIIKKGKTL